MTDWEYILLGLASVALGGLILFYVLIPLFLLCFHGRVHKIPAYDLHSEIEATLLIPAWDEQGLSAKMENTLALDRSGVRLQVIVISDQPPPQSLPNYFRWIVENQRMGKSASINRAMLLVSSPLVIFSDANTELNTDAIRNILLPFRDEKIGAVSGEKRVQVGESGAAGERLYWRYESALKQLDANQHSLIGGAGELFAMRKGIFEPLPEDCLLDDLELSWQVIRKGFRIAYAPEAVSTEAPSPSLAEEAKRKLRLAAGAYQFLSRHAMRSFFSVSPAVGWLFFYRKWFRWVLAPVSLVALLFANMGLLYVAPDSIYTYWLSVLQGGFYIVAGLGYLMQRGRLRIGWFMAPFYFLFMHGCQLGGWFRHLRGKQPAIWEKSVRSPMP